MKLIVRNASEKIEREVREDFDRIVNELGIANDPFTVVVKIVNEPPSFSFGPRGFGLGYTGGSTDMEVYPSNVIRVNLNIAKNTTCACGRCNKNGYLGSLRHEMGHVWQLVSGNMRLVKDEEGDPEAFWYYGKTFYPEDFPRYENQPWEIEAREIEDRLSVNVGVPMKEAA